MNNQIKKLERLLKKAGEATYLPKDDKYKVRSFLVSKTTSKSFMFSLRNFATIKYMVIPVLIIFLGGGVTIASANTLPGDLLYSVKTEVYEPIRGLANIREEEKIAYQQLLANRRLNEMIELEAGGQLSQDMEDLILQKFERHRQKIEQGSESLSLGKRIAIQSNLESALRAHGRIFSDLQREDVQEKIEQHLLTAIRSRIKTEEGLNLSLANLEASASGKEEEVSELIDSLNRHLESEGENRITLQARAQIDLAKQALETGIKDSQAGSFAKAIVQYEKANRLAREAGVIFTIQSKYALQPRSIPTQEAVFALEDRVRQVQEEPQEITYEQSSIEVVEVKVDIYQYFVDRLSGIDPTARSYISNFPGLLAKDFDGVVLQSGMYKVVDDEIRVEPDDFVEVIELEGHRQLLINIATRLGLELSSPESIDSIIQSISEKELDVELEL